MRTAARAARATHGPPVISIVVTPSLPTPLSAAGARVPGGVPRLPPWSFLYWTEHFRRRPASTSIS